VSAELVGQLLYLGHSWMIVPIGRSEVIYSTVHYPDLTRSSRGLPVPECRMMEQTNLLMVGGVEIAVLVYDEDGAPALIGMK
jgi:hypothetical protein